MEDAICFSLQLPNKMAVFGVFDGHGGTMFPYLGCQVARFVAKHFVYELTQDAKFRNGEYEKSLVNVFKRMDDLLMTEYGQTTLKKIQEESVKKLGRQPPSKNKNDDNLAINAGCTANVVMISQDSIYVANAGDSRAVLCRAGKAYPLSFDHKPEGQAEIARITKAGGTVENGRINGGLNLTRSLGDFHYKSNTTLKPEEQLVIYRPDVARYPRTREDDFIILGCDGVWDRFGTNNQGMVDMVRQKLKMGNTLDKVTHDVLNELLAPAATPPQPGTDNMSMVLIYFHKK